jgi:hypothetical protein
LAVVAAPWKKSAGTSRLRASSPSNEMGAGLLKPKA